MSALFLVTVDDDSPLTEPESFSTDAADAATVVDVAFDTFRVTRFAELADGSIRIDYESILVGSHLTITPFELPEEIVLGPNDAITRRVSSFGEPYLVITAK